MATVCRRMLMLAVLAFSVLASRGENSRPPLSDLGDEVSLLQVDPGQVRQGIPSNVDFGTLSDRGVEELQRQEYVSEGALNGPYGGLDDPLNLGYQASAPGDETVMPASMGQEIFMPYSMSDGQFSELGTSSFQGRMSGPTGGKKTKSDHLEGWVKIVLSLGVGCMVIGTLVCGYARSIEWSNSLSHSESHEHFTLPERRMKYAKAYLEAVRLFGWWPTEDRPGGLLYIKIPKISAPDPPKRAEDLVKNHFRMVAPGAEDSTVTENPDGSQKKKEEKDSPIPGILGHYCPKCKTSWRTGYRLTSNANSSEGQGGQEFRSLQQDPQPPYDTHCDGTKLKTGVLQPTVENHFYVGIMVGQIYENLCDMDMGTKLIQRGDALFFLDLLAHTLIVVLIPLQGSFGHNFIDTLLKVIMVVLAVFGTIVKGINQVHQPGDKEKEKLEYATTEYGLIRDLASLQGQFSEKWREKEKAKYMNEKRDTDKSTTTDGRGDDGGCADAYGTKFIHYPVFVELFDTYMRLSRQNAASAKDSSHGEGSESKSRGQMQKSTSASK